MMTPPEVISALPITEEVLYLPERKENSLNVCIVLA
jgi:hypothetical protein